MEEAEALALFLDYLRDGVIVGHHIGHDIEALNCACERHFGERLKNRSLHGGLCQMFGVTAHDRHTAGGDAFLTAQIFCGLLSAAKAAGRSNLGALCQPYQPH